MITFLLILALLLTALILILCGAGGFVLAFGWMIFIIADIALGIWIIVKTCKAIFVKKNKEDK